MERLTSALRKMWLSCHCIDQITRMHQTRILLTSRINVGNHRYVRRVKSVQELPKKRFRSAIHMWLVDRDQSPLWITLTRRLQCGRYRSWMVGVIVHQHKIKHAPIKMQRSLVAYLKTPPDPAKALQCFYDGVCINAN